MADTIVAPTNQLVTFGGSMSKLDAKARAGLPTKDFAEPGERKYPVEDPAHAANAKARAAQMFKSGRLTSAVKAKIDAKADAVLARGK